MKRRTTVSCGLWAMIALGASACGNEDLSCLDAANGSVRACDEGNTPADDAPAPAAPVRLDRDLSVGSRGQDVGALHAYLTQYGYFPNEELANTYPRWRPIVAEPPQDLEVYDEQTLAAVTALQRAFGLTVTGSADASTRAIVERQRCGVPEGIAPPDPSEKFDLDTSWLPRRALSWRVLNVNGALGVNLQQVTTAANNAFSKWSAATGLTFSNPSSGIVDIPIRFERLDGVDSLGRPLAALAFFPKDTANRELRLNTLTKFSGDGSPAADELDVESLLLHEIGHTLGLRHSSALVAVMHPGLSVGAIVSTLQAEDKIAISAFYDEWVEAAGGGRAIDIAVADDSSDAGSAADAWIVSTTQRPNNGGREVRKWNGTTWDLASGGKGAIRVAVSAVGIPWIIDQTGAIFERSSTSVSAGTWQPRGTQCAIDIGVGASGGADQTTTWAIGCQAVPGGSNFPIYEWNPGTSQWVLANGAGKRISVDQLGVPWVTALDNSVWRRTSASALTGTWVAASGRAANDIAAGPIGIEANGGGISYPFIVEPGSGNIYVWGEQNNTGGNTAIQSFPGFFRPFAPGVGSFISVQLDGSPWVIAGDNRIWQTAR
jgi:hypothetical protein